MLLALENQTEMHTAMPVKNMILDALRYGEQVSQRAKERRKSKEYGDSPEFLSGFGREDKIKPIITLVIYWKDGSWEGPKSLHEMFDYSSDWMDKYVNDYKIHVIVPDEIKDFTKFRTELGQALEFISLSQKEDGIRTLEDNERFRSVSNETVNLLNVCTGAKLALNKKGGKVNMCKGIEDMKQTERRLGRDEGRREGKSEGLNEGKQIEFVNAIERVAKNAGGIAKACTLYGTTEEEYRKVKKSLAIA